MRTPAVLFACALALGAYTLDASSNAGLPSGWSLGGEAPKLYAADVESSDSPSGQGALVLRRTETSHPYGSAWLAQGIAVAPYAGKRVRVSMHLRFQGTDPMEGKIYVGTDSSSHLQGMRFDENWAWFRYTLTLPPTLRQLDIGVSLKGPGSAKVDSIELQVLGDAPPEQHGVSIEGTELHRDSPGKAFR